MKLKSSYTQSELITRPIINDLDFEMAKANRMLCWRVPNSSSVWLTLEWSEWISRYYNPAFGILEIIVKVVGEDKDDI